MRSFAGLSWRWRGFLKCNGSCSSKSQNKYTNRDPRGSGCVGGSGAIPSWLMQDVLDSIRSIMAIGGWVMYPLLGLSVLSLTLSFERITFWMRMHARRRVNRLSRVSARLRRADLSEARALATADSSFYGRFIRAMLNDFEAGSQGAAIVAAGQEHAEAVRPAIERFSVILSTIITAAPMPGILGTVTGIIQSFHLLGGQETIADPASVAVGIAEALYTTAFGLVVALITLFPYSVFRAQADRAFSRIELLAAAFVEAGVSKGPASPNHRAHQPEA